MKKYQNMHRVISVLLVLAMLLPCIGMTAFSQDIPCVEDGCSGMYRNGICSSAGHYEAAPVEEGVYRISNAGQLYWFAALVNAGANEFGGDNGEVYDAVLTNDIVINADMDADDKLAWTPIGLYTSAREYIRYSGTFDGAGYTIYGLYYDNTNYDGRNAGLFGMVDGNGVVRNLTLADSVINGSTEIGGIASYNYGDIIGCTQSGIVSGTGATGGIVCRNLGVVGNCVNTGAVSGATTGGIAAENNGEVSGCSNSGAVSGTSSVGGIVGMNDGFVSDSLNTANVTASVTHVGGVAGNHVGGEIIGSGNTGDVTGASDYIGGVAGVCSGANITESYNTGDVIGNTGKSEAVGGVVGAIDGTNTDESVITSCYNTGKVSGKSWVGGIAGISGYQKTPETVTFTNSYNTGAVSGTSDTGAVVGKLSKGTVSGIYYLQGGQNTVSGATAATAAEFASGEIAAQLNEVSNIWYQALDIEGIEPDASPVLDPAHGVVYRGYCNCTELGYTNRENYDEPGNHVDTDGDNVCDICGHVEGEAHEHSFGDEWTVTREPTCSETGLEERQCTECGWTQKREIPTAPHTEETIPGTPATFDETGLTEGKICELCGEVIVAQETIPALDYNEGIVPLNTLNVSCGDYETGGGANEGPANLAVDNNLNTIWHTDWYGTSRDNHWIQFELTEDYVVDGLRYKPRITGNTNGIITQYDIQVSDDGVNFTSVAAGNWAGDRNWKVVEFDAQTVKYVRLVALNALTDNAYVFACAAEIRLTGEKAEAPHEHSFGEWTVTTEPTCTEEGVETRTCACGETETRTIAALGHTEEIIPAVEPTCTETGLTEGKKCSVCGEILVAQEVIPALGHDWSGLGCTRCDATRENPFVDVKEEDFFLDPVLWAAEEGITTGMGENSDHFAPALACNRAQAVTFLWRAMGQPGHNIENPFVDVKAEDFYYDAVLWALENGITTGIDPTHFNPNGQCNRAQVVTFLWRAMGKPVSEAEVTFPDVPANEFYYDAVAWAVENGITTGLDNGTFGSLNACNRAQVVTFLYRALA